MSCSRSHEGPPNYLLVGPFDPHCGEYTFLAPPLGVWRLAGALQSHGINAQVFDPNCCGSDPAESLATTLRSSAWDVIGFSTTAMTLRHDLQLAHRARALAPKALLVAGGMEATFRPEQVFELGPPFDLIVLGEGEKPLLEIATRLRAQRDLAGISGTALRTVDGAVARFKANALDGEELAQAVRAIPYQQMPYEQYWQRLERAYAVGELPFKADREARLSEIRSVRLITLNYCPMACSFCSSTNYLHEAQGSIARVARLDAAACLEMLKRIVAIHRSVRTIIFQDDIFVFTKDQRVLPLCELVSEAKRQGELPHDLQFISTNRIDAMSEERLVAMRRAGFRVLGFGIENFSATVLREFNKGQIHSHIQPVLTTALRLGITPFLDLIMASPRSTVSDIAENIRRAIHWHSAGCEIGMYPYVIPFSGAAIGRDATLLEHTVYETVTVPGTKVSWRQATKILPVDGEARDTMLAIERRFECSQRLMSEQMAHIPSRVRAVAWLDAAQKVLSRQGIAVAPVDMVTARLPSAVAKGLSGQGVRASQGPARTSSAAALSATASA